MIWIIVGVVLVVLILWVVFTYNNLISLKNLVENSYSQIDVQLKRRADLVENLVNTVKGYMKYEKDVLTKVTEARTKFLNAKTLREKAQATNALTEALKTVFAVAENYPDLKANNSFIQLQNQLSELEEKIAYARQFYNDAVYRYNTAIQQFPTNVLANALGFKEKEYFEAEEEERKVPKVEF